MSGNGSGAGRDWSRDQWDAGRGLRYYSDPENNRYVYQNGMHLTPDGVEHWPRASASSGKGKHRPVDSVIAEASSMQLFRPKPTEFFKRYRVFALRPSRDAGANNTVLSNLDIEAGQYGTSIFVSNVLRFVVVGEGREGETSCLALPISSYHGQGVAASGVVKGNHGIIYTGKYAPLPTAGESPSRNDGGGMVPNAIRVSRSDPTEKLHPMSRVDYGSPKRIPFDEPVHDIGVVHPNYEAQLISQFNVVQERRRGQSASVAIPALTRVDSEPGPSRSYGFSSSQMPRGVISSPQTQQARLAGSSPQAFSPGVIGPQLRRNYDRMEDEGMQRQEILMRLTQTYQSNHPDDLSWEDATIQVQQLLRMYP